MMHGLLDNQSVFILSSVVICLHKLLFLSHNVNTMKNILNSHYTNYINNELRSIINTIDMSIIIFNYIVFLITYYPVILLYFEMGHLMCFYFYFICVLLLKSNVNAGLYF